MQRRKTHEFQALEKWLQEMLTEDVLAPQARSEAARKRREDLEQRAKLAQACMGPLLDQAAVLSPKLGSLLERVFERHAEVLHDSLRAYRVQLHHTEDLAERMQKLITFAERQLRRGKFKAELASERAACAKEECDDISVSMRVLREEHAQLRQQANDYAGIIQRITDNGAQELEWSIAAHSDGALDDALNNLEQEQRRKLKSLRDLDKLVVKLEMDQLQALSSNNYRLQMPSAEVACATDKLAPESALEALAKARGRVAKGSSPDLDPPIAVPKRWRVGWNIPFALREQMSTFQINKRVLQVGTTRKLIYSIYASRNNPVKSANTKDSSTSLNKLQSTRSGNASAGPAATSGSGTPSIFVCTHQYFSNLYGLDKLTDWHLTELLNSVDQHRVDARVAVFGYLVGVIREADFRKARCAPPFLAAPALSETFKKKSTKETLATAPSTSRLVKKNRAWSRKAMSKKDLEQASFDREDRPAVGFLFDLLDKIAGIGDPGVSALAPSEDERAVLPRTLVLQITNAHSQEWSLSNTAEILRAVGALGPVDPASSMNGLASPVARPKAKLNRANTTIVTPEAAAAAQSSPPAEAGAASTTAEITRSEPDTVALLDVDEVVLVLLQGWVKHEREWRTRLRDIFFAHCTVKKFSFGGVQTCTLLCNAGLEARKEALEAPDSKEQGFFGVMDVQGFRAALRDLGSSANKRQASTIFTNARNALVTQRRVRSEAVWLKAVSSRPEDKGRSYYINQISNERVWDERPLYDSELDEIMSANADFEIDVDTFVRVAMKHRWDTVSR